MKLEKFNRKKHIDAYTSIHIAACMLGICSDPVNYNNIQNKTWRQTQGQNIMNRCCANSSCTLIHTMTPHEFRELLHTFPKAHAKTLLVRTHRLLHHPRVFSRGLRLKFRSARRVRSHPLQLMIWLTLRTLCRVGFRVTFPTRRCWVCQLVLVALRSVLGLPSSPKEEQEGNGHKHGKTTYDTANYSTDWR